MNDEALDAALSAGPSFVPSRVPAEHAVAYRACRHNAAGVRFASERNYPAALTEFSAALAAIPTYAEAWLHRGMMLQQLGDPQQAYDAFAQAAILAPLLHTAEKRLTILGAELGRPATILTPWIVRPHPRFGGRFIRKVANRLTAKQPLVYNPVDPTEAELRELLLRNSRSAASSIKLGRVLYRTGRHFEAECFLRYAVALEPWSGEAAMWLCVVLEHFPDRRHEAKAVALAALAAGAADPRLAPIGLWNALHAADWQDYDVLLAQSIKSLEIEPKALGPLAILHLTTDLRLQRKCIQAYCQEVSEGAHPLPPPSRKALRPAKLTIGYISSDFRNHAGSRLFAELFELHDRKRFKIYGYATWPDDGSSVGRRVRRSFDKLVDFVGMRADEAASVIRNDDVDILIDVTGNASGGRPKILHMKPARVQVGFLGFPGTVGSPAIDYSIVDRTVVPPEHASWYTEALVYMPNAYQVNDRKRQIAAKIDKKEAGLPNEAVVYCCFNHIQKINPTVFSIWMKILSQVPNSVLWLYAINPAATENLRREAARRGIDGERLLFCAYVPYEEHLARYRHVDVFLDTQPYGAHTTASDALWAGCPVVTLLGTAFAGRVGASLLKAAGIPDLITESWADYERLAVRIGRDVDLRNNLRHKIAANRATCALFDTPRFCRQFEWALDAIWARYMAGEKPTSFDIPAEDALSADFTTYGAEAL
jgi:predicted O-linked N-acetylglucosamine transferase (SPINDLY family)